MIQMDDPRFLEYVSRVILLVEGPRKMTLRAARVVVGAAMFGEGCIEGEVRAKIESEKIKCEST